MAFCLYSGVLLVGVIVNLMLSFLECFVQIQCSSSMVENYVSAIQASFVLYELLFAVFEHPKIKHFFKSLRINRPLTLKTHNMIDLLTLRRISLAFLDLPHGRVYRAIILTGYFFFFFFFAFIRLHNLTPHSLTYFDPSWYLTVHDIFTRKFVKLLIKWPKKTNFSVYPFPDFGSPGFAPFSS